MKLHHKMLIHRVNHSLNQPKAVIVVLLILFAYFAHGSAQFNKQNAQLLTNGNTAIIQLDELLCKGVKPKDCNLTQAVIDLKNDSHTDNHNQTILLCKLFLTGRNQLDAADQAEVEQICNVDIQQFTSPASESSQASGQAQGSSAATGVSPSGSGSGSASPNTTPTGNNSQSNNPPKTPDCTIDILFLHAGACK